MLYFLSLALFFLTATTNQVVLWRAGLWYRSAKVSTVYAGLLCLLLVLEPSGVAFLLLTLPSSLWYSIVVAANYTTLMNEKTLPLYIGIMLVSNCTFYSGIYSLLAGTPERQTSIVVASQLVMLFSLFSLLHY